ncbi:MAG: hypothetical protein GF381_02290 [Candidatus Pacebacteria bacterium]|nr:hypothetical protein [Candidatus Paceibacterota bacterium]
MRAENSSGGICMESLELGAPGAFSAEDEVSAPGAAGSETVALTAGVPEVGALNQIDSFGAAAVTNQTRSESGLMSLSLKEKITQTWQQTKEFLSRWTRNRAQQAELKNEIKQLDKQINRFQQMIAAANELNHQINQELVQEQITQFQQNKQSKISALAELQANGWRHLENLRNNQFFEKLGQEASRIWGVVPTNQEQFEQWRQNFQDRRNARWQARVEQHQQQKQEWEQELGIDNIPQEKLDQWQSNLYAGQVLQPYQLAVLILNQQVGTSRNLLRSAHKKKFEQVGIELRELVDWLRFQWEKKLHDNVLQSEDGLERIRSILKKLNLKLYEHIRHAAIAEAGVDRFGRPNLTGLAPEDSESWLDRNIARYWRGIFQGNITFADRDTGYFLGYFPTLIGLILAPGAVIPTKTIASALIGLSGAGVQEYIDREYGGDREQYLLDLEQNERALSRFRGKLAEIASRESSVQLVKGIKGAGLAYSIFQLLDLMSDSLVDLQKAMPRDWIEDHPVKSEFTNGPPKATSTKDIPKIPEPKNRVEPPARLPRRGGAEPEELSPRPEATPPTKNLRQLGKPTPIRPTPSPRGAPGMIEGIGAPEGYLDWVEVVDRRFWDGGQYIWNYYQSIGLEHLPEQSNSIGNIFTRLWREINPDINPTQMAAGNYNFFSGEAERRILVAIEEAYDSPAAWRTPVEELLVSAGEAGEPPVFTQEQARFVLNEILDIDL